jgi:glutamyl-tRNA synthetase
MTGRFAPSPTGPLHVGNLRTAMVAWLSARSRGDTFIVRFEDLDRHRSSSDIERGQLADLSALGIDWDGIPVRQSERFHLYDEAIERLAGAGLIYRCFCTRREILDSPRAPHGPPGAYPGTCRDLSDADRDRRLAAGRPPALRLRSDGRARTFEDRLHGTSAGAVDDVVVRRNDGVPAYNLAVVVDDIAQGVTDVVRGDDLLASTPRHVELQELLGAPTPSYLHVPLVVGPDGERLAKRHGAVTLHELRAAGVDHRDVIAWIGRSIGIARVGERVTPEVLVERFDEAAIPREVCRVLPGRSH